MNNPAYFHPLAVFLSGKELFEGKAMSLGQRCLAQNLNLGMVDHGGEIAGAVLPRISTKLPARTFASDGLPQMKTPAVES